MESCDRCGLSPVRVGAFRVSKQVAVTKPPSMPSVHVLNRMLGLGRPNYVRTA